MANKKEWAAWELKENLLNGEWESVPWLHENRTKLCLHAVDLFQTSLVWGRSGAAGTPDVTRGAGSCAAELQRLVRRLPSCCLSLRGQTALLVIQSLHARNITYCWVWIWVRSSGASSRMTRWWGGEYWLSCVSIHTCLTPPWESYSG